MLKAVLIFAVQVNGDTTIVLTSTLLHLILNVGVVSVNIGIVHSIIRSQGFKVMSMCNTSLCMERGLYCMIPLPESRLVCIGLVLQK